MLLALKQAIHVVERPDLFANGTIMRADDVPFLGFIYTEGKGVLEVRDDHETGRCVRAGQWKIVDKPDSDEIQERPLRAVELMERAGFVHREEGDRYALTEKARLVLEDPFVGVAVPSSRLNGFN